MLLLARACFAVGLALLTTACHSPSPRPWLRYELDGPTDLASLGSGRFEGVVQGAAVSISLADQETRVRAVLENRSDETVAVALGPHAGAPKEVIGEVLLRQLEGPAVGASSMTAYAAMTPVAVEGGWRATFYLDQPVGREIKLGQYFVLAVQVEGAAGSRERVYLPLVAKMGSGRR